MTNSVVAAPTVPPSAQLGAAPDHPHPSAACRSSPTATTRCGRAKTVAGARPPPVSRGLRTAERGPRTGARREARLWRDRAAGAGAPEAEAAGGRDRGTQAGVGASRCRGRSPRLGCRAGGRAGCRAPARQAPRRAGEPELAVVPVGRDELLVVLDVEGVDLLLQGVDGHRCGDLGEPDIHIALIRDAAREAPQQPALVHHFLV